VTIELSRALRAGTISIDDAAMMLDEVPQLAAARSLQELSEIVRRVVHAFIPAADDVWLAPPEDAAKLGVTDRGAIFPVGIAPVAASLHVSWTTPRHVGVRERALLGALAASLPVVLFKAPAATEARLQLLVDSIKDYAVFMLDPRGRVASWNPGAERIKQYQADEIIGRHFSTFYAGDDVQSGKCELELDVATRTGRFEDEGWRVRKDGSRFWANVVISAIRDGNGTLVGFSKVTRDLTERRRNEEERAARLAAEEANRAKDEFLAILGHELRNPLAPITTALELLRQVGDTVPPRVLAVMERQVSHLTRLVDDLLDVSRVTSGKVRLARAPLYLADVVARAIEIADPLIEQRGHQIEIDVPREDLRVHGDELRLIQVVSNLLTNAVRYTAPGGRLRITAACEGAQVVLRVADNGSGISRELLPRIFGMFVQGGRASDRSEGGLGLGLALVRSLVELHGGSVTAHSEGQGKGSEFVVRLPRLSKQIADAVPVVSAPAPSAHAKSNQIILIVDDNVDAAQMLGELLRQAGHEVQIAHDGAQALLLLQQFRPDVAVLDIGLPVMDGYELAEQLRAQCTGHVPYLIALTGYGQAHDRAQAKRAGFDEHLVKPVDTATLLRTVRVAMELRSRAAADVSAAT
jgi:PAS domain S-box-containing protein